MAVLIEAVSVIVRRDAIERKVPGGWEQFATAVPTAVFCYDDSLAQVGFMSDQDAMTFLGHLRFLGLTVPGGTGDPDVAIVDQTRGFAYPVSWLRVGKLNLPEVGGEVLVGYLEGATEHRFVAPGHWRFEGSISQKPLRTGDPQKDGLKFLRRDGGVDVYWDDKSGKEVYTGSPYPRSTATPAEDAATIAQGEKLAKEADALIAEAKVHEFVPPKKAGWLVGRKLRRAVDLYRRSVELRPTERMPRPKRSGDIDFKTLRLAIDAG